MPTLSRLFAGVLALALVLVSAPRSLAQRPAVEAPHGLVTSAHELASRAGVEILQRAATPSTPPSPPASR
ncbi:hypothetical protein [Oleiharenicola sp. Vm1]|uniref:hypothetical protein n=1 Tax=Oleiharenicola sp. Vm1 TaxID=3398393 RepID=UPI0039F60CE6